MKKLILLLAAVALATSVWAQDTPKKPSFAGFVSNGFWDNWEITLGGGAGTALSNGTNQGSFGDRINFEANFGLTKWFHLSYTTKGTLRKGSSVASETEFELLYHSCFCYR